MFSLFIVNPNESKKMMMENPTAKNDFTAHTGENELVQYAIVEGKNSPYH